MLRDIDRTRKQGLATAYRAFSPHLPCNLGSQRAFPPARIHSAHGAHSLPFHKGARTPALPVWPVPAGLGAAARGRYLAVHMGCFHCQQLCKGIKWTSSECHCSKSSSACLWLNNGSAIPPTSTCPFPFRSRLLLPEKGLGRVSCLWNQD